MRTKYMIWTGESYKLFASKYLACAEADFMAREMRREVFVETWRRCAVVYVGNPEMRKAMS